MVDREESIKRLLRRWQKVRKRQAPIEKILPISNKYNRKREKEFLRRELDSVNE